MTILFYLVSFLPDIGSESIEDASSFSLYLTSWLRPFDVTDTALIICSVLLSSAMSEKLFIHCKRTEERLSFGFDFDSDVNFSRICASGCSFTLETVRYKDLFTAVLAVKLASLYKKLSTGLSFGLKLLLKSFKKRTHRDTG